MKLFKKAHKLVGQNEQVVKKPHKHDANLQNNSTLYFQVGLILTLLASYGLFEMNFESKIITFPKTQPDEIENVYYVNMVPEIKIPEPINEVRIIPEKKVTINKIKIVKDEMPLITKTTKPAITFNKPTINTTTTKKVVTKSTIVNNIMNVEQVPIYPGCEGLSNNDERRLCMSKKVTKLIQRKFNTDLASDLGLRGKQKIYVEFKIGKQGNIIQIKARAPHPRLKKEAIRVVDKIPQMIPGKQRDKNVEVIYTLPIIFKVEY